MNNEEKTFWKTCICYNYIKKFNALDNQIEYTIQPEYCEKRDYIYWSITVKHPEDPIFNINSFIVYIIFENGEWTDMNNSVKFGNDPIYPQFENEKFNIFKSEFEAVVNRIKNDVIIIE